MTAPMMINGAMNGEAFLAYVHQCVVPTLVARRSGCTLPRPCCSFLSRVGFEPRCGAHQQSYPVNNT
jgi:hypothetical protein